jgi:hypothetical protein
MNVIQRIFGVTNPKQVSRNQLIKKLAEYSGLIDQLITQLYLQNERLPIFTRLPLDQLNLLKKVKKAIPIEYVRPQYLDDTADFAGKFGLLVSTELMVDPKFCDFRLTCLREEVNELEDALNIGNPEGVLDALVDLIYFAFGTVRAFGLGSIFGEAWRRVHEANLKKVRVERAEQSKRGSTFDVVKPDGWTAPDLSDLITKQEVIDGQV